MYKSKTIVIAVIAFFSLQQSFGLEHIYNYEGVTSQSTEMVAYACDVDAFPFQGNQLYLNVKTKATNANYVAIAEDDAVMWQIGTPGAGDENFFWFDVKINENVNAVAQIDLQFNGRTSKLSFALFQNIKIGKMAHELLLCFFITYGAFPESNINS